MVDDLVVSALRKAIEKDLEFRLVALGEAPEEAGLFPDRKGPAKKAIRACSEGDKPLLLVRDEPGKGKTRNQFARITEKGIGVLVGQTPLEQLPELVSAAAPLLRTKVLRSCLRSLARRASELDPWKHRRLVNTCLTITRNQFDAIESRLQDVLDEEQLLSKTINEFLETTRGRVRKQTERLTADLENIANAVSALVSPNEIVSEGQSMRPRLPDWQRVPTSDVEIDFQKNLAEELVFAWQDAVSPDTRAALERALFNVGVERLNSPGDFVRFDGASQHSEDGVSDGEPVEVILPGWKLISPRGTSLIARAKVIKTSRSPARTGTTAPSKDGSDDEAVRKTQSTVCADAEPEKLRSMDQTSEPCSSAPK